MESANQMDVLVTGGSGFLGINLVRKLIEHGVHSIKVLDLTEFDYPEKGRIQCVIGDIRDKLCVNGAMAGCTHVVHTAAALPLYSRQDIMSTDVDGTRILLDAAQQAGIARFIHISSTAVYGIPDHHPLLEDDSLKGVGPYGKAKISAEEVCIEFRSKGMVLPIIRPKSFIGPERLGVFALLYDWAKDGKNFPMIGTGKNRYQLLDVEDLADIIWVCLTEEENKVNQTFNIGAKEFRTMKEDFQAVLDYAGFGKKVIGFPAAPAIWALRFLELLHLSPLYKWVYETACEDSFVSIDKARDILGFTPRFSNQDSLIRNFQWYVKNMDKFTNVSGVSHRVPWKQGILGFFKRFF